MQTEVLIIDDCSMLSWKLFDMLEAVCSIKNPSLLFGGMQLVLCGDFRQLAPVPNALYSEDGAYCFESPLFCKVCTHKVILTEVIRQQEELLIKSIQEVAQGSPSPETIQYIENLSRPLPEDDNLKLFATNDLVDDINRDSVLDFPGPLFQFKSKDSGDRKRLNGILAPPVLGLKIGCPVILLRNLTDKFVNGLIGTVYDLTESGPVIVEFPSIGTVPIEKFSFTVYDPRSNRDIAFREQYPLKLAFGMTIHKSQGMTLDRVEVDYRDIFKPGQLGVAMGRVRTSDGLRVKNFSTRACIQQPMKVQTAMEENSTELLEDISCCRRQNRSTQVCAAEVTTHNISICDPDPDMEIAPDYEEEFDDEFNNIIASITENDSINVELPHNLDLNSMLQNIIEKKVLTPIQAETNEIIGRIDQLKFQHFVKKEYSSVTCIINTIGPLQKKNIGKLFPSIHEHLNSTEYTMNCLLLFSGEEKFTNSHKHICFSISTAIRKYFLGQKAQEIAASNRVLSSRSVTTASRARVRYVGGYCVAKVRQKYMNKKKTLRYSLKESDKQEYEEVKCAVDILNNLKEEEYDVLASTDEPDSLIDITRRQNVNRGLTNISDTMFHFFVQLTEKCLALLIDENFNREGSEMFQHCRNEIMSSSNLFETFVQVNMSKKSETSSTQNSVQLILNEMTLIVSQLVKIYNSMIKQFLLVMFNQFRKDLLESFQIEKKMAHRKQVRVSSSKKNLKTTLPDSKSATSSKSSKLRKGASVNTEESQPSVSNITTESNRPESELVSARHAEPSTSSEPGPSTPSEAEREVDISAGKQYSSAEENEEEDCVIKCKKCDTVEIEGQEWIMCDGCSAWLHRNCAGLRHHMKWKKCQRKGAKYYCTECT